MWGRKRKDADAERPGEQPPQRLRDALRKARVDQAERSAVVVDLHDAEVARLELLNEALDPLFEEVPKEVDLFDRGISRGETPRLWIDAIAHVCMGPDKRVYRFLQETRSERRQRRRRALKAFLFGVLVGVASLIAAALIFGPKS